MKSRSLIWMLLLAFFAGMLFAGPGNGINVDMLRQAGKLLGFSFSQDQLEVMMPSVRVHMQSAEALREMELDNDVPPAWSFSPLIGEYAIPDADQETDWSFPGDVPLPDNLDELAFYGIPELASLIHQQKISSEELTLFFLERLARYDDTLQTVVSFSRERALEQARQADALLAAGESRGILHGIPYGVKDLLAVEGYPTTWGAEPFRDQHIEKNCQRGAEAG